MTQCFTILEYLGRKHNLAGKTDQELIDISLMMEVIREMIYTFARVAYDEKCDELKPEYLKKVPVQLKQVADFLKGRKYVTGDRLTFVDFWVYEGMARMLAFTPDLVAEQPVIKEYIDRIEALPAIAAYKAKEGPIIFNAPMAKWNAKY